MNSRISAGFAGVVAGAISWGVVGLVSDKYEPFDSGIGLLIGQSILSAVAFRVGYKKKLRELMIYLVAAYVGMNLYSYIFGGSEQRAWAYLGVITTIALMVFPLVFGVIGIIVRKVRQKYNKSLNTDAASGDAG
jgi:hypothetical protein